MHVCKFFSAGFLYDLLSIDEIKYQKNSEKKGCAEILRKLHTLLLDYYGQELHYKISASEEYKEMLTVNELIYDKLDNMKKFGERNGDALEVDGLVYRRFLAKQALQNKFFPNNDLGEQKFGYVKEKS